MIAKFISSDGEYLEARIEIDGMQYFVMDEFGGDSLDPGAQIEIDLSALPNDEESWEQIFQANPERKKELRHISGWSYFSLGQITAVNPVVCDCGVTYLDAPISTTDEKCIGEFIGFKIDRLDANST